MSTVYSTVVLDLSCVVFCCVCVDIVVGSLRLNITHSSALHELAVDAQTCISSVWSDLCTYLVCHTAVRIYTGTPKTNNCLLLHNIFKMASRGRKRYHASGRWSLLSDIRPIKTFLKW